MTNLFGSLDIDIWDFIGIWCLGFDISEYLNTRDSVSKDYLSIEYSTVKFHTRVLSFEFQVSICGSNSIFVLTTHGP